jgi:RNA polymerase sigma-70 factor (ECF subfamily)
MYDTPDHQLLESYRSGDREAFAVLVARHQGVVRAACLRQAPAGDVEDCVQAVFLVLARRPGPASRAPALVAWLLCVSRNVCRRAQRGTGRRRVAEQQMAQVHAIDTGIRPEALDHLDECLSTLPERQRIAVSMQYLAEYSADEVAKALGVSRDNAYQLVSRGLATLRILLARRGIALSAPALLALLASEGHAATVGGASDTISKALEFDVTPSTTAVNLAAGVTTAMILTAPSTIMMMAASLVLVVGATALVVTAEPAAPSEPPVLAPVQPTAEPARSAPMNALDLEISVDFQDMSLRELVKFFGQVTNLHFVLHPHVENHRVTLQVNKMQMRHLLAHVGRLTGTAWVYQGDAYVIDAVGIGPMSTPGTDLSLSSADATTRARLEQRVTFDFADAPLTDIITFLRQVLGLNIVVMPEVVSANPTVTLKARDMTFHDALAALCRQAMTSLQYVDGALVFDAPATPSSQN